MTRNQIEYLKHKETQRSNLRQEELTAARDATARELGFSTLAETQRHNIAGEEHNVHVLGEQQRHNIATEQHNVAILGETQRHNLAQEEVAQGSLDESRRSNLEREQIERDKVQVSLGQLALSRLGYEENVRSNLARESETHRANVASEALRQSQIDLGYSQLAETSKYHAQSISLGYGQLAETRRTNSAREAISLGELQERQRANVANEALIKARDKMNFEETVRSNLAREEETRRHNTEEELLSGDRNAIALEQLEEVKQHNIMLERQGAIKTTADAIGTTAKYIIPMIIG